MSSYRAQGFLAAGFGLLGVGVIGCSTPSVSTDLRPEGPPEVLAVLILNENFDEAATYCKPDDEKVPVIVTGGCGPGFGFDCCTDCVGICPEVDEDVPSVEDAVSNAEALAWQVRVVFDELLDPNVEVLYDSDTGGPCTDDSITCDGSIATTNPVTLTCGGVDVAYDGFYDPTGNAVTLPPGPSLVIFPLDFVATSSDCSVSVNGTVHDKDNNPVAPDSYDWSITALQIIGTTPEDTEVVATDTIVDVSFNSLLDAASIDAGEVVLQDSGGTDVAVTIQVDGTELLVVPDAPLTNDETYTLTIPAGSDFADIGGGGMTTADDLVVTFTIEPAA